MKQNNKRRKIIGLALAFLIVIFSLTPSVKKVFRYPEELRFYKGHVEKLEFGFPFTVFVDGENEDIVMVEDKSVVQRVTDNFKLTTGEKLELTPLEIGELDIEFRLFGHIPLRSLDVEVIEPIKLIPGGNSVGIKLSSGSAMVVGFHELKTPEGTFSPGEKAGLQKGDSILEVEGNRATSVDKTVETLEKYSPKKEEIEFLIDRNGKEKEKIVEPYKCSDEERYLTGIYIQDTKAGVGTMTYLEPENNRFGALGHSVSTNSLGDMAEITNGKLVNANIISIKKGENNAPGEKRGLFLGEDESVGTIDKNVSLGVFGNTQGEYYQHLDNLYYEDPIPVGFSQHVEEGSAEMLTVISGSEVENFEIEIKRVMPQNVFSGKGMVIEVTDEELLEEAGGIIQGMSGSPIIQDGKLVGAVTHVFLNNAKRGYAAFIEWMLDESEELETFNN